MNCAEMKCRFSCTDKKESVSSVSFISVIFIKYITRVQIGLVQFSPVPSLSARLKSVCAVRV